MTCIHYSQVDFDVQLGSLMLVSLPEKKVKFLLPSIPKEVIQNRNTHSLLVPAGAMVLTADHQLLGTMHREIPPFCFYFQPWKCSYRLSLVNSLFVSIENKSCLIVKYRLKRPINVFMQIESIQNSLLLSFFYFE